MNNFDSKLKVAEDLSREVWLKVVEKQPLNEIEEQISSLQNHYGIYGAAYEAVKRNIIN
jgi:hypothetical protein